MHGWKSDSRTNDKFLEKNLFDYQPIIVEHQHEKATN